MSSVVKWRSESPEQTRALGRELGRLLNPGDVVAVCGVLGAGKTQLVKGIAAGLDVPDDEPVISPTFVLVREYLGRLRLYHVDAYRLTDAQDLWALGVEEMCDDPQAVVAVEWADRVAAALPPGGWRVDLAHAGQGTRRVVVRPPDEARRDVLARRLGGNPKIPG